MSGLMRNPRVGLVFLVGVLALAAGLAWRLYGVGLFVLILLGGLLVTGVVTRQIRFSERLSESEVTNVHTALRVAVFAVLGVIVLVWIMSL